MKEAASKMTKEQLIDHISACKHNLKSNRYEGDRKIYIKEWMQCLKDELSTRL